ncbi:hypothetical protein MAPG_02888 [Magnaporthiopsis poae ATCC 64411]|uniref:Uncharacterized protein n=1 Tax=Magnaporthiopsis poae (strain ATCC 64411 / 73-15) TaxID=644358 RepID=A0A0C4DSK6_MAGP6|nr:hypothetical protein MAPG_02888 [Magnaporthiopsis poae ATCC 64411]
MTPEPDRSGRGTARSQDDAPPPPYSETDVFSSAGAPTAMSPQSANARQNSLGDNVSSAGRSASSSGEPIYTPPLTPQSSYQQNFGSSIPNPSHIPVSPAAAAYFDSRPRRTEGVILGTGTHTHHTIRVKADSSPDDFPYPEALAPRDVTVDDWHTFINYLLPNYSVQSNSTIIDRKLRAEGLKSEDDGGTNTNNNNNSNNNDETRSTPSGRVHVEAQLDTIRTSVPVETPDTAALREQVERTVGEWNGGFFGPRNVTIFVQVGPEDCRVPGAWDRAFDQTVDGAAGTPGQGDRPAGGWQNYPGYPPQHPPYQFDDQVAAAAAAAEAQQRGGFRLGSLHVGQNGISYGDNVVIDSNQVRIGGFTADTSGIRLNGRTIFPGVPGMDRPSPPPHPAAAMPPIPGHPYFHPPMICGGGGPGRWGGFGGFRGLGRPGPHHHPGLGGFGHHPEHHGFGSRRGGRGFGRGSGFGGWGGGGGHCGGGSEGDQRTPGSWPAEADAAPHDPHAVSRAKHREADQLEVQIAQLAARISELGTEDKDSGDSGEKKEKEKDEQTKKQLEDAMTLQQEVAMLEDLVAQIRLEADGDFAKELAQEEQRNFNNA